jgi:subtilisin family serine protease
MQSVSRSRRGTRSLAGVTSALALVASMVLVSPPAHAAPFEGTDKIAPELAREFESESAADFWVRFADRASFSQAQEATSWAAQGAAVAAELRATAEASQERVVDLVSGAGVEFEEFWITNAVYVYGGTQALAEELAAMPEVSGVYLPVEYELIKPTEVEPDFAVQAIEWGIENINANDVWDQFGVRGQGITVASIDTGTQFDHPALVGAYRGNLGGGTFDHNYNWFDAAGACPNDAPCDTDSTFGHGTHTMGTMVGDDGADNQIGVAPEANWITTNGCCPSSSTLIASGQWLLEPTDLNGQNPDASKRPNIINNSWGTTVPSNDPFMEDVIEAWDQAGIMSIWSNGNGGPGCATSGAPGSRVITYSVGNYAIDNQISSTSARGPGQDGEIKPNISAPGSNVRSANPGDTYRNLSGTSMAAPHVAGTVALLWSAAPALIGDIQTTRELLDQTAVDTEDLQCGGTAEDNNVYGEGRLDALALLQSAPIGDAGTIAGTVTEAGTGDPIAGAEVSLTGAVERTVSTGDDGAYDVLVPPGDYTVTAESFGYQPGTASVSVTAGETTTQDFALAALDTITVSGTVTDGSGYGWPMYTRIAVQDHPVTTYTDPVTGAYSLDLPVGETYVLSFASQLPGYATAAETVDATGGSDVVLDVALVVDQCTSAPGYGYGDGGKIAKITTSPTQGFDDLFADHGIPVDFYAGSEIDVLAGQISDYGAVVWGYNSSSSGQPTQAQMDTFLAATDAAGVGVMFLDHAFTTWNGIRALSNLTGNPASTGASSSGTGQQSYYQVTQAHPILDGFAVGDQIIHEPADTAWMAWFDGYEGEGRQVIADAGRTNDGILGSGIGVQERANNRHVLMSIHSSSATRSPADWSPESEQIFWNALGWVAPDAEFPPECVTTGGGLVVGHVTDLNTGEGINGATVASAGAPEEATTTVATPDDPNLDDGFFWMFSSLTGSQEFTASSGAYQPETTTVDVAPGGATEISFSLAAGRLEVDPTAVETTVRLGNSDEDTFTVTNTGTAPVEVTLSERRGDFEILNTDGSTSPFSPLALAGRGAEVQRVPADASYGAEASGGFGTQVTPAAPTQEAWEALPTMPRGIMDNNVVLLDGAVYSIGGTDGSTSVGEVYKYDIAAGSWEQLPDGPGAIQATGYGAIDGMAYLVGGFGDGLDGRTRIFDPATGGWSTGAAAPGGRAAPGSAVLDGQLYVVAGCTTGSCSPFATDVFRYDPLADSWETLAPYPEPAAFLSCGGVSGVVVCAGGVNGAGGLASTYVFDPASGSWTQGADMPVDLWGSGYHGANGMLLVSGGAAQDGAVLTNEGYAYDPLANAWETLPAANNALYRGGSSCGFYRIGGSSGSFNETDLAEVLPGFDLCGAPADVPWLAVDPAGATLAPGDSFTVTVSMDSADVAQPGAYTAGVGIRHDTPYSVPPVDVTMNVTPPNRWGKITGTVTGVDCDGGEAPLPGAVLQINGRLEELTLRTDATGGYAWWMPVKNNPLQMIAATGGHVPQTRTSQVVPRQVVTEDFALREIC